MSPAPLILTALIIILLNKLLTKLDIGQYNIHQQIANLVSNK